MLPGLIVEGKIGIPDASLVRHLEGLREHASCLGVRVTESTYAPFVQRVHLELFLSSLMAVDWIAPPGERDQHAVHEGCAAQNEHRTCPLPEQALLDYTRARMLKQVDVWSEPRPAFFGKYRPVEMLAERLGRDPARRSRRLALVSGSFDIIHIGHILLMQEAKAMADVLIVAAQGTSSIRQQPKNNRGDLPIYGELDRLTLLGALACVDYVVMFDELDCRRVLEILRPDLYVKHERDRWREIVAEEADLVDRLGGHTVYTNVDCF